MPWKNGLGSTLELLKEDLPGNAGFAWRLSMADVTTDGSFSNFTGYDRCLLLVEGNGITLTHNDGRCDNLTSWLQAAHFNGDDRTFATLHDGSIRDFNIMSRRGVCSAEVIANADSGVSRFDTGADIQVIYAMNSDVEIRSSEDEIQILASEHLFVIRDPSIQLSCSGGATICTRIVYL